MASQQGFKIFKKKNFFILFGESILNLLRIRRKYAKN